jgi:hypothetical protein
VGYRHIDNLYKDTRILLFKRCFAMEKIHGTSAHVGWKDGQLYFYSGGAKNEEFIALFDHEALEQAFKDFGAEEVVVYGEAYGGKMQRMRETYGDELRFIAFEVKINEKWCTVPAADAIAQKLGFEFVHWEETFTDVDTLDKLRDAPSVQARRNGITEDKPREGIVLRPPFEVTLNNGGRLMAKHKSDAFKERERPPKVGTDPMVLEEAGVIAMEWVVPERIRHVCDAIGAELELQSIGAIIKGMKEDIAREGKGEIKFHPSAWKAIAHRTALLVKEMLKAKLREEA